MKRIAVLALFGALAGCQELHSPLATEESLWARHQPPAPTTALTVSPALSGSSVPITPAALPADAPHQSIRIGAALDRALADNLDLALARAEQKLAESRSHTAKASLMPAIQAGGGYTRTDGQVQGSFGDLKQVEYDSLEGNLGLIYRLNIGAQVNQIIGSRREVDAAVYQTLSARQKLLLRVTQLYYELVISRVGMAVAEELLANSKELKSIAEARAKGGVGTGSDVARTEARIADAERQVVAARNLWQQASIRLAVTLRMDPAILLEPAESQLAPWRIAPEEEGGWAVKAAENRPDVQAAQSRSEAAEKRIDAAQWDLWGPEVVARVEELLTGDSGSNLDDRSRYGIWIGWTLSLEKYKRIDQARSERMIARLSAARLKDQAVGEVHQSASEIRSAADQIPLANREMEAAKTNLRLNTARFKSGTALAVELIDAQDTLTRATLNLAQAIGAYNVAQAKLLAAAGILDRGQLPAGETNP